MSFAGLRILGLESRRSAEMAELIRKQDGVPFIAPSLREAPVEANYDAFEFGERLIRGDFDMLVLLTGVGTRQLDRVFAAHYPENAFVDALRRVTIAARGPKPVAALREMGLIPHIVAPEPNTWRELLDALNGRPERRVAVQEYGRPATEFVEGLRARGCDVTTVRVYNYALPDNLEPLREAAQRLAAGEFDIALFTTAVQIVHLMRVAEELEIGPAALTALHNVKIGSIGPTTTEALEEFGLHPDMEPSHPKMGILVREAADRLSAAKASP
jgi:uroporphyrinogen-III synthase